MLHGRRRFRKTHTNNMNQYELDIIISDMTLKGYTEEEINEYLVALESEVQNIGN